MEDRKFTVILEDIRAQFRVIAEDHQSLKTKADDIFEMVGKNREDIEIINPAIKQVLTEVRLIRDELKVKVGRKAFKTLEKQVISLEEKVASLS